MKIGPAFSALPCNICRKTVFVLGLFLVTGNAHAQTGVDSLIGRWLSFEVHGIQGWDENRCVMIYYTERQYNFHRPVGTVNQLDGVYVSRYHGRFMTNFGGKCKAPNQDSPKMLFAHTRFWSVTGRLEQQGALRIHGKFWKCTDDACEANKTTFEEFTTRLQPRDDGALLDPTDSSRGNKPFFFRREGVQAQFEADVAGGLERLSRLITAEGRSRLSKEDFSSLITNPDVVSQILGAARNVRARLVDVSSRQVIEARYADTYISPNGPLAGPFGVVLRSLTFSDGSRGLESAWLHKERGNWRIVAISWYW